MIAFPNSTIDPVSKYYHLSCKYFIIKHKPWVDNVNNAWGGKIVDPTSDTYQMELEDDNIIDKQSYKYQSDNFIATNDIKILEVVHSDVY